jgi:hypothetical protein
MESHIQVFKEIHEIFHLANIKPDTNFIRCKILDFLFSRVHAESSVFFLPNQKGKSKGGIEVNLDEKYVKQYKEYYYRYDPIQLINEAHKKRRVILLQELMDYRAFTSSEFYCDFLRPQKIHHKLYINLYTGNKYHGRIALFRPAKSQIFSKKDINVLNMISPYLAHALDYNELFIKNSLGDIFLEIMDENGTKGVLLFDESLKLIYMNRMAKDFCRRLMEDQPMRGDGLGVPSVLLSDCRAMADELSTCHDDCLLYLSR